MPELEGSHLNHMRHPSVEEPGESRDVCSLFVCLGSAAQCFLVSFVVDLTKHLARATQEGRVCLALRLLGKAWQPG